LSKIVVTGGNGFIGSHLVKKLLSTGSDSVIVISNSSKGLPETNVLQDERLTYHTVDIRNNDRISQVIEAENPRTCIHLAAKTNVPESIKNPAETIAINVKGTENILDACSRNQVRNFIFASSAAVYGDVTELPISEEHSLLPLSPYGKSKMLAEKQVCAYGKLNKIQNTVSLRIFNVYGVGQTAGSDVVTKFAKRLSEGLSPIICGNGSHTRDFISVDDVTDSILLSIKVMESNYNTMVSPPIFNIGSGTSTSIADLAQLMISIAGLNVNPIYEEVKSESGVILHSYADVTKAQRYLGFVAKKDLEAGLREILTNIR
jgi:UDP-glucose 4-epimerase